MSLQMYFCGIFVIFILITQLRAARLNAYTPLSDQTYQDLLQQQFSQNLQQQQRQQEQQRQQQQLQYDPQIIYGRNYYDVNNPYQQQQQQQQQQQHQQQSRQQTEFGRNFKDFNDIQYVPTISRQQLPQYRQQIWTDRPIGTQYNQALPQQQQLQPQQQQQQFQQQYIPNIYTNGLNYDNIRQRPITPIYQVGSNLRPFNNNNNNNFYGQQQNQLGLPSSRDFVQLGTDGRQLYRQPTNDDYASHFNSYLRKYPQRLEPQFGVNRNFK